MAATHIHLMHFPTNTIESFVFFFHLQPSHSKNHSLAPGIFAYLPTFSVFISGCTVSKRIDSDPKCISAIQRERRERGGILLWMLSNCRSWRWWSSRTQLLGSVRMVAPSASGTYEAALSAPATEATNRSQKGDLRRFKWGFLKCHHIIRMEYFIAILCFPYTDEEQR